VEFIKAGGSYAIFGKKATDICCYNFKYRYTSGIRCVKEISIDGQGLTAVEIFNKKRCWDNPGKVCMQVQMCVEVNIVGSQDTTGLMTSQELESMAATVISPIVDGAYQSGCHTASVWDNKSKANIPRLMKFMNDLITARDPKGEYLAMTDVIHKYLMILRLMMGNYYGGDSHKNV
jgi:aconitate hydratase 2/2-methylisocitrate dehydratase